jgi:predicted Zn-dependent protease
MTGVTTQAGARAHPAATWLLAMLAAVLTAGCATVQTTAPGAIGVERRQQMLVSESEVDAAAQGAYAKELTTARTAGKLNADAPLLARVRRISDRLIPQTAVFRPEAPQWKWEVNVQSTPDLNAYCMPGGKIMVYSGLVEKLELADAELAAVIGHEMAHALREHTRERVSRAYAQNLVLAGVAALAGLGQGAADLAGSISNVTFQLPHSRAQEEEADIIGLELMARAGYDPEGAVSVWRKMAAAETSAPPQFLSTHPSSGSRIADLQARIPVVQPLFEATRH